MVIDSSAVVATLFEEDDDLLYSAAIDAFRRFGKGRHRAALTIGDGFSYALACATGEPLLFKGDDFTHTDIKSALPTAH